MKFRFLMVVFVALILAGCATSPQAPSPVNQLQNQVGDLQQRMEQQEKEVADLQYEVQGITEKMEAKRVVPDEVPVNVVESSPTIVPTGVDEKMGIIKVTGLRVVDLQKALQSAGFYDGKIDGKIGSKTRAAVVEFQKQHNLKSDGIVGKNTWAVMKTYIPVE